MTLDLDAFSPAARARQIKVGQYFGSQNTLNQANRTLAAFGDYGAEVTPFGFNAKDALQLKDARDMLVAAGVDRESSRGKKKVTSQTYAQAPVSACFELPHPGPAGSFPWPSRSLLA